jgi:hypothetical protein
LVEVVLEGVDSLAELSVLASPLLFAPFPDVALTLSPGRLEPLELLLLLDRESVLYQPEPLKTIPAG